MTIHKALKAFKSIQLSGGEGSYKDDTQKAQRAGPISSTFLYFFSIYYYFGLVINVFDIVILPGDPAFHTVCKCTILNNT